MNEYPVELVPVNTDAVEALLLAEHALVHVPCPIHVLSVLILPGLCRTHALFMLTLAVPGYRQGQQLSSACSGHNAQSVLRKAVDLLPKTTIQPLILD